MSLMERKQATKSVSFYVVCLRHRFVPSVKLQRPER